jgi:hypothetical protein
MSTVFGKEGYTCTSLSPVNRGRLPREEARLFGAYFDSRKRSALAFILGVIRSTAESGISASCWSLVRLDGHEKLSTSALGRIEDMELGFARSLRSMTEVVTSMALVSLRPVDELAFPDDELAFPLDELAFPLDELAFPTSRFFESIAAESVLREGRCNGFGAAYRVPQLQFNEAIEPVA